MPLVHSLLGFPSFDRHHERVFPHLYKYFISSSSPSPLIYLIVACPVLLVYSKCFGIITTTCRPRQFQTDKPSPQSWLQLSPLISFLLLLPQTNCIAYAYRYLTRYQLIPAVSWNGFSFAKQLQQSVILFGCLILL
jgi:hypothetical protein